MDAAASEGLRVTPVSHGPENTGERLNAASDTERDGVLRRLVRYVVWNLRGRPRVPLLDYVCDSLTDALSREGNHRG